LRAGVLQARLITAPSVTRMLSFVYPKDMAAVTETPEFRAFVNTIVERLHAAPGPVTRRL
jgi:LysR family transcriptional regulator, nitrogen assimilation regulatory protein